MLLKTLQDTPAAIWKDLDGAQQEEVEACLCEVWNQLGTPYRTTARVLVSVREIVPHGNWTAIINSDVIPLSASDCKRLVAAHEFFEEWELQDSELVHVSPLTAQKLSQSPPEIQEEMVAKLRDGERVTQKMVTAALGPKEPKAPKAKSDTVEAQEVDDAVRAELAELMERHDRLLADWAAMETEAELYRHSCTSGGWVKHAQQQAENHGSILNSEQKVEALLLIAEALGLPATKELKGSIVALACTPTEALPEANEALPVEPKAKARKRTKKAAPEPEGQQQLALDEWMEEKPEQPPAATTYEDIEPILNSLATEMKGYGASSKSPGSMNPERWERGISLIKAWNLQTPENGTQWRLDAEQTAAFLQALNAFMAKG